MAADEADEVAASAEAGSPGGEEDAANVPARERGSGDGGGLPGSVASAAAADDADAVPDTAAPQDTFRRFELTACGLLQNTGHLRAALSSGKRVAQAPPTRGAVGRSAGLTPIEAACQAGMLQNVKLLIKEAGHAGLVEESDDNRARALSLAADAGASDVVSLLIKHKAQVNITGPGDRPPLLTAVRDGYVDIVEALCACPDTDVNARDRRGSTAVHEAVCNGSSHLLECLIERKANPAIADSRGWTPLHLAAHFGNVDAMARLLDAGAPIDGDVVQSAASDAAGIAAFAVGDAGDGAANAEADAPQVGSTNSQKNSVENGEVDVVDDGDAPPAAHAGGWSPLHLLLARSNQDDKVRQYLTWGADASRPGGQDALTPLMLSISLGQEGVALQLISVPHVAETVDDQDRRGRCSLHFAVASRSEAIVRGLLEVYADPGIRTQSGLTPIDIARSAGLPESSGVVKRLQVEEIVRLVMQRSKCRVQNKYEESELIRGDLRLRGVAMDVQNEKWSLPDGTWGYLSAERSRAQPQSGAERRASMAAEMRRHSMN